MQPNSETHVHKFNRAYTYHHHFLFLVVPLKMPMDHLVCLQSVVPLTSENQN